MSIVRKARTSEVGPDLEFVLSDETKDRYGDVIVAAGWNLAAFRKNPIALFGHASSFPIGSWSKVRVEGTRLLGKLEFAAPGTSARIDELRALVEQGILRAVSVGFRPLKEEPMDPDNPWQNIRYLESELLETSLVSVPANPNAVQLAKSLHVSDETLALAFGEHATEGQRMVRRGSTGEHAAIPSPARRTPMKTLAERIADAQTDLNTDRDRLTALTAADDTEPDALDEATRCVEERTSRLAALNRAEAALAARSTPANASVTDLRRPFAEPAGKKIEPVEFVYRSLAARVKAHHEKRHPLEVLRECYGDDETAGSPAAKTRAVFDVITRAASAPAMTTTVGWAAELVQTAILDFVESLMPDSVYPRLSGIGGRFGFGQNGIVSLPTRSATPTVAGSFVGQGAPIPVRQAAFAATTLTPKKMAVITTLTREMAEHSTPSLEGVLRTAIQEDTAVAIDTVLLDAVAISTIRPAGLRNGVTVTTATAGGGFAALVGDIKALVTALITASAGQIRNPVWIMNPIQAISIGLTQNAGGDFPFAAGIAAGTLQGYPVIKSSTVTAGMLILVDAADFFSATGDEPRFDVSDQATLHMEDTTPLPIATGAQGAGVLATPTRSLFQTDSIAIRMILDMNWALRRVGTLAWTQSVTW